MGENSLRLLRREIVGAKEELSRFDGSGHAEPDQAVGPGVGEGAEEDPIDDREDGGAGTEMECEREDGGDREERTWEKVRVA